MKMDNQFSFRAHVRKASKPARRSWMPAALKWEPLEGRTAPAAGGLDLDFDTDGIRTDDLSGSGNDDRLSAVAVQANGNIVAAGFANDGTQNDFLVVRYTPDGNLDPSFGAGGTGIVTVDVSGGGTGDQASGLAVQPDGRIVVAGTADQAGQNDFAVIRLDVDGNLDPTFNGTGVRIIDLSGASKNDAASGLALQPDGFIVVAGSTDKGTHSDTAFVRLDPDGNLDTSFNATGIQTVDASGASKDDVANAVAIQPDGRIVSAGRVDQASMDFSVVRLDTGGNLDGTFNGTGFKAIDIAGGSFDQANALAVQDDGRIVIAGSTNSGGPADSAVVRLDSSGAFDTSFDTDGIRTVDFSRAGKEDFATAVAVQGDGRILVAGGGLQTSFDFFTARFDLSGNFDGTFAGGVSTVDVAPGSTDLALGVTFQPDNPEGRMLVAAGRAVFGGTGDSALVRVIVRDPNPPEFTGIRDDTGANPGDQITADNTLILLGIADPLTRVTVTRVGVGAIGTVDVDGFGEWMLDYTGTTLPDGKHEFTAVAQDSTGTTSPTSASFFVTVDSSLPPGGPLNLPNRVGVSGTDGQVINVGFTTDGKFDSAGATTAKPIPAFTADVRSAIADVNGDGKLDVIAVRGPGGPSTLTVQGDGINATINDVFNDPGFTGGLFVGAADLDGDGKAEIFVTPDVGGGGRVTGFRYDGTNLVQLTNFIAINDANFRGGARVALGDINGDGTPDLIVGAGFGGGPRVSVFDGQQVLAAASKGNSIPGIDGGEMLKFPSVSDFFAFTGTDVVNLRNGVFLNSGDFDGDGKSDFAFGGGPGGAPRVFIISGAQVFAGDVAGAQSNPIANFFDGNDSTSRGGVRVAAKDADGDALADLVTGSGENQPALVRDYLGKNLPGGSADPTVDDSFAPFGGVTLANGVFVG